MSLDAITWARHQKVGKGPTKSVLMALADFASEEFVSFPSIDTLIAWTEQDRKTVLANIDRLKEAGWITDTGERTGRTKQIVVYQINPERGVEVKVGPRNQRVPKTEQSQNRYCSENGTVPDSTGNSPNSAPKQSQFSPERGPNLGHVTVGNSNEQEGNSSARGARLPKDWLLPKTWGDWALKEQPTWTADHVRRIAEKFRDYWVAIPGTKARKSDWEATWRNWVRGEKPLNGAVGGAGGAPNKQEQLEQRNREIAAAQAARIMAGEQA
ncbi:helix-turn-helix domain-containing protein [Pandoraea norimbergensis]